MVVITACNGEDNKLPRLLMFTITLCLPLHSSAHLVHVENEIQLTDILKAFIQRFHKHLQHIWAIKCLISL